MEFIMFQLYKTLITYGSQVRVILYVYIQKLLHSLRHLKTPSHQTKYRIYLHVPHNLDTSILSNTSIHFNLVDAKIYTFS